MNAASIKSSFSLCRLPGDEPVYLAMLSMEIPALKLIVPKSPFWRKHIVFSAFSYLGILKGIATGYPMADCTARYINLPNQ
jgi:hypothetical protein